MIPGKKLWKESAREWTQSRINFTVLSRRRLKAFSKLCRHSPGFHHTQKDPADNEPCTSSQQGKISAMVDLLKLTLIARDSCSAHGDDTPGYP